MIDLKTRIKAVNDFPKPGIVFRDITTLLEDPEALKEAIRQLSLPYKGQNISKVVGIESRGFIFGVPLAIELGVGFVPIRKPGKLPREKISVSYELEYGTDEIEIHKDALKPGEKIIIVDDLLATGGTVSAAIKAAETLQADIVGLAFLIELNFLNGRQKLKNLPIHTLISY